MGLRAGIPWDAMNAGGSTGIVKTLKIPVVQMRSWSRLLWRFGFLMDLRYSESGPVFPQPIVGIWLDLCDEGFMSRTNA